MENFVGSADTVDNIPKPRVMETKNGAMLTKNIRNPSRIVNRESS